MSDAQLQAEETYFVNGVNASTGRYIEGALTPAEIVEIAFDDDGRRSAGEKEASAARAARDQPAWALTAGVSPSDLAQTGWGVIFAADATFAVLEALQPLLRHRREQAGDRYREYAGDDGYHPNESWESFRVRHGVGTGLADPEEMAYYILIVGSPEAITYTFQYELDVERSVGRIYFDTPDEYAHYAQSVVGAEQGQVRLPRRAAVFATHNPDDRATELSSTLMAGPLHAEWSADLAGKFAFDRIAPEQATKAQLAGLLGGAATPALLFSATHGAGFNRDDTRLEHHQGALVTADWPGPLAWQARMPEDHYFSADDVAADAKLWGLIAIAFACYGAGTPALNDFVHRREQDPRERLDVALRPFVAPLPRRLLSHPNGGALAVVGHVDRAWDTSFRQPGGFAAQTADIGAMERLVKALVFGFPLGHAMEELNSRHAQFATTLTNLIHQVQFQGLTATDERKREMARLWTANQDARNYIILGDPAVRLAVAATDDQALARPVLQPVSVSPVTAPPAMPPVVASTGSANTALPPAHNNGDTAAVPMSPPARVETPTAALGAAADDSTSFTPLPGGVPPGYRDEHPELYAAWVKHVTDGYRAHDDVFRRILNAFMRGHYSSLVMQWVLFVVGVGLFVTGVALALTLNAPLAGALFGGLSVVAFLTYFVSRPTQAVEENLYFIAWLGMVYNSYWTHLAWTFEQATALEELETATKASVTRMQALIDRHAASVKARPGLSETLLGRGNQGGSG